MHVRHLIAQAGVIDFVGMQRIAHLVFNRNQQFKELFTLGLGQGSEFNAMPIQNEPHVAWQVDIVYRDQPPEGASPQKPATITRTQWAVVVRGGRGLLAPLAKKE